MKVILDQGLGGSVARLLRDAGHVADLAMEQAADSAIVELARREDRVVVTLDADFGAILALSGLSKPSVIRLRIEGAKSPEAAAIVDALLTRFGEVLGKGAIVAADRMEARVRMLPLVRG